MSNEEIIHLGPEEELITVSERLEKVNTERIILVVPPQAQLRSLVAWRLLHTRMRDMGKDVLIISSDRQIRAVVKAAGFRVADSLESPPSERPVPQKPTPSKQPPSAEYPVSSPVEQENKPEIQVTRSKVGWNMTSSLVNPVLAVARRIAARSPLGRDITALSPQVAHISRASQETATVWSDLVTGNFWQKALFRAYLERILEGWLYLHMEAHLSCGPNVPGDVLLRQASEPAGVALPTSVAEKKTEPYYVEKNLGPGHSTYGSGWLSSSAKPDWQVVYEARHSHRQVFRIARTIQNPHTLSIILGLQPEEEAALSDLVTLAPRRWELARLLMAAEDKVNMEHLANRVERAFTAPTLLIERGRPPSGPPRQELLAELQHAVAIGREQKISGPEIPSPSPNLESKKEYGTGVTLCFDETVKRVYGFYQCPECATTNSGGANIGPFPHKPQCKKRNEGYKGCLYFFGIYAMRYIQDWAKEHGNESREPENHLSFQELVSSLGEDFVEEKLGK